MSDRSAQDAAEARAASDYLLESYEQGVARLQDEGPMARGGNAVRPQQPAASRVPVRGAAPRSPAPSVPQAPTGRGGDTAESALQAVAALEASALESARRLRLPPELFGILGLSVSGGPATRELPGGGARR